MQTMGERLKWCRKRFGWTQAELARESGVGIATIRRIEQYAYEPRMETARRLAAILHVREGWLAFGDEPLPSQVQVGDENTERQVADLPDNVRPIRGN
jgi:transcriptional regulator with XRE-family HTH domain